MICIRCGNVNAPPVPRQCRKCSALLPRMAPTDEGGPTSTLELEEGRSYLVPRRSFPTRYLYDLTCRAHEYLYQGAPGDPLLEAYEVVRERLEVFETGDLPVLVERMRREQRLLADDDYYAQVMYLLHRGVAIMREGFEIMDAFISSGEPETLRAAVLKMQEGNDNLGLARELSEVRVKGGQATGGMSAGRGGAAFIPVAGTVPAEASSEEAVDDRGAGAGPAPVGEGRDAGPPTVGAPPGGSPPGGTPPPEPRPSIRPRRIRPT